MKEKESIVDNKSFINDFEGQLIEETENITFCTSTEDFQEGIKTFFEKRNPLFKGK